MRCDWHKIRKQWKRRKFSIFNPTGPMAESSMRGVGIHGFRWGGLRARWCAGVLGDGGGSAGWQRLRFVATIARRGGLQRVDSECLKRSLSVCDMTVPWTTAEACWYTTMWTAHLLCTMCVRLWKLKYVGVPTARENCKYPVVAPVASQFYAVSL